MEKFTKYGRITVPEDVPEAQPIIRSKPGAKEEDDFEDLHPVDEPIPAQKATDKNPVQKAESKPLGKKYEITRISGKIDGAPGFSGYRIRALRDFADVKKGDLGGYVQRESNLSQEGDCWIFPGAIAAGFSTVKDDATLSDGTILYDRAVVSGNARVANSSVGGSAKIYGNAFVADSTVTEYAEVFGNAIVEANSALYGHTKVYENAIIHMIDVEDANVHGDCIPEDHISGGDYTVRPKSEDLMW